MGFRALINYYNIFYIEAPITKSIYNCMELYINNKSLLDEYLNIIGVKPSLTYYYKIEK